MTKFLASTFGKAVIVAGIILAVIMFWWLVFEQPRRNADRAAQAEAGQTISKGDTQAATDAVGAVADQAERQAERERINQENRNDILSQPGASSPTDDGVHDALTRSLCKREAYRDRRECVALRQSDPR